MNNITHYDLNEWTRYYYDLIEDDMRTSMDEHLLSCQECMDIYLSVVDNDKNIDNIKIPSENFTKDIMNKLSQETLIKKKTSPIQFKKVMLYYVSAASITIFFTAIGLFNYVGAGLPRISAAAMHSKSYSKVLAHSGWSERLTDSTSMLIDSLLPNNKR